MKPETLHHTYFRPSGLPPDFCFSIWDTTKFVRSSGIPPDLSADPPGTLGSPRTTRGQTASQNGYGMFLPSWSPQPPFLFSGADRCNDWPSYLVSKVRWDTTSLHVCSLGYHQPPTNDVPSIQYHVMTERPSPGPQLPRPLTKNIS